MPTHARTCVIDWLWVTAVCALTGVVAGSACEMVAGANTTEPAVGMTGMVGVGLDGAVGSGVPDITSRAAAAWSTSFHAADMVASG